VVQVDLVVLAKDTEKYNENIYTNKRQTI